VKVLIVEPHGDGLLDLAIRAKKLGHDVYFHCRDYDQYKAPIGRGLVERVPDWRAVSRRVDLVILGSLGYAQAEFDKLKADGIPVIGAPGLAGEWELNRLVGMQQFKRAGIPVPPYQQCASYDEAIAIVARNDDGVAIKPCGDVTDKSLSFVAKTGREAVWRLQRWKREGKRFPQGFILQELVKGVEFAVGAWCGPAGFADGWEENWEGKRMFAGDVGPNTGEMYTVMRLVKQSKMAQKVLAPFEDRLVSLGFCGNVDVNCIVDENGTPWPLEFTCRFGYPAINIELALHRGDPIEYLAGLCAGKPPKTRAMNEVAVGIVLAIPPYPFGHEKPEEVVGSPIWGVTPGIEDNLHYVMVQAGEAPRIQNGAIDKSPVLATAGSYVLVSTGVGDSVTHARDQALRVLNRLSIPSSPYWRVDAGSRLRKQIPALQEHGFATGMAY
jgi:phosphoribosylamine--glycine ligase